MGNLLLWVIKLMGKIIKSKILLAVLTGVLLVGLFMVFKPNSSGIKPENAQTRSSSPRGAVTRTFALKVEESQVMGDTTMQATQGDDVIINIESKITDEIHLHGYDKEIVIEPGEKYRIEFTADQSGRFEIELHEAGQVIAALEVQPKL